MKTDIEIAQEAQMVHVKEVAAKLDIAEEELDLYGKYKAKLSDELIHRIENNPDGKLVLVTAINPTPAGEGKTTTSVGLADGMQKIGKKVMVVTNLKPAKLAGILSEGMILCAEDEEGKLSLMVPEREMPAGAEIC